MNRCREPVDLLFLFWYEPTTYHLPAYLFEFIDVSAHVCPTNVFHCFDALFQGVQFLLGEAVVPDEELSVGRVALTQTNA